VNPPEPEPLAVLTSGGLDSAILVADLARERPAVQPIYVRAGLAWEDVELDHLHRFLAAIRWPALRPLVVLEQPVRDLYGPHWSLTGEGVPDAATPDAAVYLPGRNLLLVLKALLWCHLHGIPTLALAVLAGNPFPDATPEFFAAFGSAIGRGVGDGRLRIVRPYGQLHKDAVLRRGQGLPLEWTFSCIRPVGGRHCGQCNKCAERRHGFAAAGMADPTPYAG
jgi:7-cyano-7-deazaguanine synthase